MISYLIACGSLLLVALIARNAFFCGPLRRPVSPPPTGIIDMHCHTAGIGAGGSGAWISGEMRNSWKFGLYLRVFGSDEKRLAVEGDALLMEIIARSIRESAHVDGAVILALDEPYDPAGRGRPGDRGAPCAEPIRGRGGAGLF